MKFSDIPGHDDLKERLRQMVSSGKMPHALLLEGPSGIGKFSLARALAQYIHCEHPTPDGDSCGQCQPCVLHQTMNHIDTQYVYPVVKLKDTPPVSDDFRREWLEYLDGRLFMDIRAWSSVFNKKNGQPQTYVSESKELMQKLSLTSHVSRMKIVLWWLPERINEDAANKLLKLIEEPFEDTMFIMVSDNPKQLLPTIYSRLQRIPVKRLSDDIVARYLQQHYSASEQDAAAVAHIAEGNMIRAINTLIDNKETAEFFDMFVQLMRLAYQRNVGALRAWGEKLAALGREPQMRFYEYANRLIRENFIYNFKLPQLNYLTAGEENFSTKFARFIHEGNVEKLIATFDRARSDISLNANAKIVNFDTAIKVIMLLIKK